MIDNPELPLPHELSQKREAMARAREVLRRVFGYHEFRGQQAAVIETVLTGSSALVLMPTGGGKSLCYQIPALVMGGLTIVVSPLIALMQNQVQALQSVGVLAEALNSSLSEIESRLIWQRLRAGEVAILYVAPERLLLDSMLAFLKQLRPRLIAIDEAHCVSQWGHDFRPEYQKLSILNQHFPDVPRLALTATADPRTRDEIRQVLQLEDAPLFSASFDRPNLYLHVVEKLDPMRQLLFFLKDRRDQSGIVYALSRKRVDEISAKLAELGFHALPYHAGMESSHRALNQNRFLREAAVIMVATVAFGMGIDKPDVRFVAHMDMPKNMEGYYQEIGRAGRDGQAAVAWLCYGLADLIQLRKFIEESTASEQRKRYEREQLEHLLAYAESPVCRRVPLLAHFGQSFPAPCEHCDRCQFPPARVDASVSAQQLLSAVYRTGSRFGAIHVINVVRGVQHENVLKFGHQKLAVFALGKGQSEQYWRTLIRQLLSQGMLTINYEAFGALQLADRCRPVLRGEETFWMLKSEAESELKAAGKKAGKSAGKTASKSAIVASDNPLFDALRQWRRETAAEQGVPPYVVFHDAVLLAISESKPKLVSELADIDGVGEKKLDKYGSDVLRIVLKYLGR